MTKDRVIETMQKYKDLLHRCGFTPKRDGIPMNHIAWMCDEIGTTVREPNVDMEKVMRWVGFVQGALYLQGTYSIDEMREHNRG